MWKDLGQALARVAGSNLEKLQAGITTGIPGDNIRSGLAQTEVTPKKRPRKAKKQNATMTT